MLTSYYPVEEPQVWLIDWQRRSELTSCCGCWKERPKMVQVWRTRLSLKQTQGKVGNAARNMSDETQWSPDLCEFSCCLEPTSTSRRNRWANILNMLSANANTHEVMVERLVPIDMLFLIIATHLCRIYLNILSLFCDFLIYVLCIVRFSASTLTQL